MESRAYAFCEQLLIAQMLRPLAGASGEPGELLFSDVAREIAERMNRDALA